MRSVAALLVATLLTGSALAGEPMSISAFRDKYAAAVAAATGKHTRVIDSRTFVAKARNGTDLTIAVDGAYAMYSHDPDNLDAVMARYVDTITAAKVADAAVDQLVVIVRPTSYYKDSLAPGASLKNFIPPRPFGGDLSLFLAVDSADSIRSASPDDLARWKLDPDAAWRRAIVNVKVRMGPIAFGRMEGDADSASVLTAAGGLAPSLLAEPEMCSSVKPNGLDEQIVLLINKDAYLFALPSDREMTARFWRTARATIAAKQSVSSTPLTCRDGHWVVAPIP